MDKVKEIIAEYLYRVSYTKWSGLYPPNYGWKNIDDSLREEWRCEAQKLIDKVLPIIFKEIKKSGVRIQLKTLDNNEPVIAFDDGDNYDQATNAGLLMHIGILMPRCELPNDMYIIPTKILE